MPLPKVKQDSSVAMFAAATNPVTYELKRVYYLDGTGNISFKNSSKEKDHY